MKISIIENLKNITIDHLKPLHDIIDDIRFGKHEETIKTIREDLENKEPKKSLPMFFPAIRLDSGRVINDDDRYETTGLVQFDIDDVAENEVDGLVAQISAIPECIYVFRSPRLGIKFAILTDYKIENTGAIIKAEYKQAYSITEEYVKKFVTVAFDQSCCRISQGCFYSYDEEVYFNPDAIALNVRAAILKAQIDEEIKKQGLVFQDKDDYDNVDPDLIKEALSYIPKDLKYGDRLLINFAVIDALGDSAFGVLINHWVHDDQAKLEKDIKQQIQDHQSGGNAANTSYKTLLYMAKKKGFIIKSHNRNKVAKDTSLRPTYDSDLHDLQDAVKILGSSINDFFETKQSKLLNIEAGAGKTRHAIKAIIKRLEQHPREKIAIFVPNHKLAAQLKGDISLEIKRMINAKSSFKEKLQARNKINVVHVQGKSYRGAKDDETPLCKHPINTTRNSDLQNLKKVFAAYPKEFCQRCPFVEGCEYIAQFSNPFENIRIYTHDYLFNNPSIFDQGVRRYSSTEDLGAYFDSARSSREKVSKCSSVSFAWQPDYIIVDEDIIKAGLSDDCIEEIAYNECPSTSKAGGVIKDIIHASISSDKPSLEEVVYKFRNEILGAADDQEAEFVAWKEDAHFCFQNLSDQEMLVKYNNLNGSKPFYSKALAQLKKYALKLADVDDVNAFKFHRVYVSDGKIVYAGRQWIIDEYKDVPKLFLDASANKLITDVFFGKSLQFEAIRIKYQKNFKVIQCENNSFSKQNLRDPILQKKCIEFIRKLIAEGKKVGLITYKSLKPDMPNFAEYIAKQSGVVDFAHFGGIRGLNDFKNLDVLVILGRHMINIDALHTKYRQLFGYMQSTDADLNFDLVSKSVVYRCSDSNHKSNVNPDYVMCGLSALDKFFNASETYQAGHRLRGIHGNKKKELYLLTNEVLDFTVDEFMNTLTEFGYEVKKTNHRYDLISDYVANNGCLYDKPNIIAKCCNIDSKVVYNMKGKHDFIKRVLLHNSDMHYVYIYGVNKSGSNVTRKAFVMDKELQNKTLLCRATNLARIKDIQDQTDQHL